jgi:hypothetical protein
MKWYAQRLMGRYDPFTLAGGLPLVLTVLLTVGGAAHAAPTACDVRLQVELSPDVANPRDAGFISSLLGNHPDYRLTLQHQDPENASSVTLALSGPANSAAGCREVVNSMRKDARVVSIKVRRDAADAAGPVPTVQARSAQAVNTMPSMGTVQAGPDGDWVLKRASGVSYPEQARIRYQCDVWAVDQTGFDPTADDGGVPPDEVAAKRADYLNAEAACFEAHGYLVR